MVLAVSIEKSLYSLAMNEIPRYDFDYLLVKTQS